LDCESRIGEYKRIKVINMFDNDAIPTDRKCVIV